MSNRYKELDMLGIFGTFLGVLNFYLNNQQANNDDLLKELKNQNNKYLDKMIENHKIILTNHEEVKATLKEILTLLKEGK